MTENTVTVKNKVGIHARPASSFVFAANKFKSDVTITKGAKSASAKSITRILALRIRMGDEITVAAEGPDEAEAVKSLTELIDSKFGEE